VDQLRSTWTRWRSSIRSKLVRGRHEREHRLRRAAMEERLAQWGRSIMIDDAAVPAWHAQRESTGAVARYNSLPER